MRNNFEQYEALLNSVNEAANAYSDMEGGEFLLAWTGELIWDLAAEGNVRGAALTVQKLCAAVGVEMRWGEYEEVGKAEKQVWRRLFAEALLDRVNVK